MQISISDSTRNITKPCFIEVSLFISHYFAIFQLDLFTRLPRWAAPLIHWCFLRMATGCLCLQYRRKGSFTVPTFSAHCIRSLHSCSASSTCLMWLLQQQTLQLESSTIVQLLDQCLRQTLQLESSTKVQLLDQCFLISRSKSSVYWCNLQCMTFSA